MISNDSTRLFLPVYFVLDLGDSFRSANTPNPNITLRVSSFDFKVFGKIQIIKAVSPVGHKMPLKPLEGLAGQDRRILWNLRCIQ